MARRHVTILLLALTLAGCAAPAAPSPTTADEATDAPAPRFAPGNQFLLDAPRPPGGTVSGGAEPMVLVDRLGGYVLVADTSGIYKSTNNGTTWTRLNPASTPGAFIDGWALAQDAAGTLYAANTQGQGIYFTRSANHGATWSSPATIIDAAAVADRPWLATSGTGNVALLYYAFPQGEACVMSRDSGLLWLDHGTTFTWPNAGNAVFDSAGRLYYATDTGVFRTASPCRGAWDLLVLPASGPQIFTQLALDPSDRMYVGQPTADSSQMTIRGFSSWSTSSYKELVVSPPALQSNTFAAISADEDEVAIAWYGSETAGDPSGPFSGQWNVYVARVTGFWTSSPTISYSRLTTVANHVGGFCMDGISCTSGDRDLLDYFGIAHAPDGSLHVAYGHDGSSSAAQVRHAHLT